MTPKVTRRRLLVAAGVAGTGWVGTRLTDIDDELVDRIECGPRVDPEWVFDDYDDFVHFMSPPTVHDGSVLVSPAYGVTALEGGTELVRIDAENKAEEWRFENHHEGFGLPRVAGDVVYVGTGSDRVYAVDWASGTERWRYDAGGTEPHGGGIWNRPALVAGNVVAELTYWPADAGPVPDDESDYDHRVLGLDAATGDEQWTAEASAGIATGPTAVGDDVVVGTDAGRIRRLAGTDGTERWTTHLDGSVSRSVVSDDSILTVGDSAVSSVALATGEIQWSASVDTAEPTPTPDHPFSDGYVSAGPAVADGTVLVGTIDGDVRALDSADGRTRWRVSVASGAPVDALAVDAAGGTAFVATGAGRLCRIDPAEGTLRGRALFVENRYDNACGLGHRRPWSLAVTDDALFVNTDRRLYRVARSAI